MYVSSPTNDLAASNASDRTGNLLIRLSNHNACPSADKTNFVKALAASKLGAFLDIAIGSPLTIDDPSGITY